MADHVDARRKRITAYYDAVALLLRDTLARGEQRLHFGILAEEPPSGSCAFLATLDPDQYPEHFARLSQGIDALDAALLRPLDALPVDSLPRRVLDVGCGYGATLRRVGERLPGSQLVGVNLHEAQVHRARQELAPLGGTVENVDFLEAEIGTFDLVLGVESAFHFDDKPRLCSKLRDVLAPGGRAWLVDVVLSDRLGEGWATRPAASHLFHYMTLSDWDTLLGHHGLRLQSVEDHSLGVARYLRMAGLDAMEQAYFRPLAAREPEPAAALRGLIELHRTYRQLGQLLRGRFLQYVILRVEAADSG